MLKKELSFEQIYKNLHDRVQTINNSKLFAGLMIVTLNIASKFVNFKLGPTAEKYLKYTFSRQILVFAMTWMGTRDIIIATTFTLIFILFFDILLNEDSDYCILPQHLREYYQNLEKEQQMVDEKAYAEAIIIVEKYKNQQKHAEAKPNT
jgi:hypothetical protein